ncbi:MAG: hypothetical protein Q8P86_00515 [bacterium]|nr:hypothetical protein [bacterium]
MLLTESVSRADFAKFGKKWLIFGQSTSVHFPHLHHFSHEFWKIGIAIGFSDML